LGGPPTISQQQVAQLLPNLATYAYKMKVLFLIFLKGFN